MGLPRLAPSIHKLGAGRSGEVESLSLWALPSRAGFRACLTKYALRKRPNWATNQFPLATTVGHARMAYACATLETRKIFSRAPLNACMEFCRHL